jgi:hypothetical protein
MAYNIYGLDEIKNMGSIAMAEAITVEKMREFNSMVYSCMGSIH